MLTVDELWDVARSIAEKNVSSESVDYEIHRLVEEYIADKEKSELGQVLQESK